MHLLYPNEPPRFTSNHIEEFVKWAIEQEASDITIKTEDEIICHIHNKKVRTTKRKISRPELVDIISYIYNDGAISKLNSAQTLGFSWSFADNKKIIRLRGNLISITSDGYKGFEVTLRILNEYRPALSEQDLPPDLLEALSVRKGIVLITGSTGSGKSRLLASYIDSMLLNPHAHLKIVTFEDPIEYTFDHIQKLTSTISQSELKTNIESFSEGLRSTLRRTANVIFIGELRDLPTTQEALKAAQKGHLLLSTLHSNNVADSIFSLINEFNSEEKIARSIQLINLCKVIVSQQLVDSTDGKRVAIREYLIFDEQVRKKILDSGFNNIYETIKNMVEQKQTSFRHDAQNKLFRGLISQQVYDEIIKSLY